MYARVSTKANGSLFHSKCFSGKPLKKIFLDIFLHQSTQKIMTSLNTKLHTFNAETTLRDIEVTKSGAGAPIESGQQGLYMFTLHEDNHNIPILNYDKYGIPLYIGVAPTCMNNRIFRGFRELNGSSTEGDGTIVLSRKEVLKSAELRKQYIDEVGLPFRKEFKIPMGHSAAYKIRKYVKPKVKMVGDRFVYPGLQIHLNTNPSSGTHPSGLEQEEKRLLNANLPFFNTNDIPDQLICLRNAIFEKDYTRTDVYGVEHNLKYLCEEYIHVRNNLLRSQAHA